MSLWKPNQIGYMADKIKLGHPENSSTSLHPDARMFPMANAAMNSARLQKKFGQAFMIDYRPTVGEFEVMTMPIERL